ncbi:Abhydrolase domain-containing protein 10 mitochondrial [Caligus rogercresseyi]|uniref:Palmitoyl-protein thioesterase ABHD10, mitochondrial n=1 Tax=Caligus rogercresseyi TaxID=217165 RepID=A0A7T8HEY6_CALRO|nr:Abhydrolase domain-containing protein 10 mitochondrial [Caligus rogercresseyi]
MKVTSCSSQHLVVKNDRRIFVDHLEGQTNPILAEKGKSLYEYCSKMGHEFIRYDPEGFGESKFSNPEKWRNIEFRHWFEDCEAAMGVSQSSRFILVGSSMGGWISLLASQKHAQRIAGLVLIAPAQNFITRMVEEGRNMIEDPLILSLVDQKSFARKSRELPISLKPDSNVLNVPVRILHGMKDDVIPAESSIELIHSIKGNDTELTLIKDGDHMLNDHMNKITANLEVLMKKASLGHGL